MLLQHDHVLENDAAPLLMLEKAALVLGKRLRLALV